MHDFSLFLLEHLLPVGGAAIGFFLIGLLIAKFIWGRYSQRLNFAVEENLNLASQWSALGSSQRDLFKKLRSRWQEDRDAWEGRIAEVEELVLAKESRIAQLTARLESSGREIPAEPEMDATLKEELRRLKVELESKEEELREWKNREREDLPVSPIVPLHAATADTGAGESDAKRLEEVEQDLVDTHDELHRVREDYLKQVSLVESLEKKLIDSSGSDQLKEAEKRIAALEEELAEGMAGVHGTPQQLFAMLNRRSAELSNFRTELLEARAENRRLLSDMADRAEVEKLEARVEEQAEVIRQREEEVEEFKAQVNEKALEIESLRSELEERSGEIASLKERVAEAEILDRRRIALQSELNDAHHEMYDVRKALQNRLEEIEILEMGIDELEASEAEALALANELKDTRHELSDVRIALNAKTGEFEQLTAEMEELEAIIEDRGAEVNDLSAEVRQQRDQIRALKESLAQKEGELEALGEESASFTVTMESKQAFLEEQSLRIADLEDSLSRRYEELNEVRSRVDEGEKAARYHEARADQISAELERRLEEFEKSDDRIASAEEEIELAHSRIEELTAQLTSSDQTIEDLREEVQSLSRDKDEVLRDLERATRRIEELETAARERETRVVELEQELRDSSREGTELHQRVEKLNSEIEEANRNREGFQTTVAELEEALRGSDDKTLSLSRQLEEKDEELSGLKEAIQTLEEGIGEKDERIAQAAQSLESLRVEMEEKLEAARNEIPDVEKVKYGAVIDGKNEEIEKLRAEITEREENLALYKAQQAQSVEEIEKLREKVGKRGDSIRELQGEISNIMMQRSARDNEIKLLKDKLRSFEAQLKESGSTGSAEISSLEETIHQSLLSEQDQGEAGTSLDELDEPGGHHAPSSREESFEKPTASPASKRNAASVSASVSATEGDEEGMDENAVYFDEAGTTLTDRALARIDEFARDLRRGGSGAGVAVIGFCGSEGSPDFNESISAKRADAVRARLIERGVPRARISVENSGQDRRFSNWRARRVELVLVPNAVAETVN